MIKTPNILFHMNIKLTMLTVLFTGLANISFGQKLKNGSYIFSYRDAEFVSSKLFGKAKVIIKGDSITVIHLSGYPGKKGEVYDKGLLMYHKKSKRWIIAHSLHDANAEEVGGCSDGPRVIHFWKNKEIEHC